MESTPVAELKLQALQSEVRVDYGVLEPSVRAALESFRDAVARIPEAEVSTSLAKGFLEDFGVPPQKSRLVFKPPESLTTVGSYSTRTMLADPLPIVDLAIRIPKSCFYEKDYIGHRYHAKRALYLAVIHKHLRKSPSFENVEWSAWRDDVGKPVLLVQPAAAKFRFRLIPTISADVFAISKLDRKRNNIAGDVPTPIYNETILEDMHVEERHELLQQLLSETPSYPEGIILLKVWLRVKGYGQYRDGLNGFLISLLVVHLASAAGGNRIIKQMSPLQIFRVFLDIIGTQNLLCKGVKLQLKGHVDEQSKQRVAKENVFKGITSDVIILDELGTSNLAFRMSKSALQEVRTGALEALAAAKTYSLDSGFDESFLTRTDFAARYDYHIRIRIETLVTCLDSDSYRKEEAMYERHIVRCLTDRAVLVRALSRSLQPGWSPRKRVSGFVDRNMSVGVKLSNFETAFRTVDIGPSADDRVECAPFQEFWGPKAELRRFKDGTIAETVAWECTSWQRHLVVPEMVRYILERVESVECEVVSRQLDFVLIEKNEDPIRWTPKILEAFNKFSKHLRSLNLPLKVTSVQPLSPAFRHTAVFPPQPHHLAGRSRSGSCLAPLEVMIQLEGSGRWPKDLVAVRKTKAAFCLKIADSLQKDCNLPNIVSEDAVDILMDGFAFRISFFYEKDVTLVRLKDDVNKHVPRPSGLRPEDDAILRSIHASMLYGLQGRYPSFGPLVRLAKRWVCAHLLSSILNEEVVELLVAFLFLGSSAPPLTRIPGLLRFLRLLANYDWALSPLIVDISGDMTPKDKEAIMACFRKGTGPAMFVATPYDMESATWTKFSPSKAELKRVVAYASSSALLLEACILGKDDRWQSLFRTPLGCYDAVVRVHKKSLSFPTRVLFPFQIETEGVLECGDTRPLSAVIAELVGPLMVGFDPLVEFVKEVKAKFGEVLDVWYDALGGDIVGLCLKQKPPQSRGSKRKRSELKPMLEEIASIGLGLVQSVHYRCEES